MQNIVYELNDYKQKLNNYVEFFKKNQRSLQVKVFEYLIKNFKYIYEMSKRDIAIKSNVSTQVVANAFESKLDIHELRFFSYLEWKISKERN